MSRAGFRSTALAVAWRTIHSFATNPALLLPSIVFPLFFVFLFLSSMNLPRNLIGTDWFREVATYNPVSYLIEAVRSLLVEGWDGEALALGFGIAAAVLAVGMLAAARALRTRMVRT